MAYGEMVHSETDTLGIEYRLFIDRDDLEVRGNALASGDDDEDRAAEDEINERLDRGDVWAWASVAVEAHFMGCKGSDHLGGCSYRDTTDFIQPGGWYWDDMKAEAKADLIRSAEIGSKAYAALVKP